MDVARGGECGTWGARSAVAFVRPLAGQAGIGESVGPVVRKRGPVPGSWVPVARVAEKREPCWDFSAQRLPVTPSSDSP